MYPKWIHRLPHICFHLYMRPSIPELLLHLTILPICDSPHTRLHPISGHTTFLGLTAILGLPYSSLALFGDSTIPGSPFSRATLTSRATPYTRASLLQSHPIRGLNPTRLPLFSGHTNVSGYSLYSGFPTPVSPYPGTQPYPAPPKISNRPLIYSGSLTNLGSPLPGLLHYTTLPLYQAPPYALSSRPTRAPSSKKTPYSWAPPIHAPPYLGLP